MNSVPELRSVVPRSTMISEPEQRSVVLEASRFMHQPVGEVTAHGSRALPHSSPV